MSVVSSNLPVNYKVFSVMLFTLVLTACGFQLRGNYLLDPELQHLNVSSVDRYGELTRLTIQHLQRNQVTVAKQFDNTLPELRILKDTLDRRTLSVFANGQVAEYELIYTVNYQLRFKEQDPLDFRFELNRDYQDDPDIALAKSRELSMMLKEMRIEAADKILRNMASIQR
ncbi:LPS assembly lipoprotein LptE [Thalassotalea sp. 1_MG-2023]|uniref:LPS-assembly lipoprotein LptE n=1 Tax=Thalassotalea sp. 1_MG-2023 TaxID=3062680 RepID=UPI0026E3D681|nr:LPS assembly lipoprotein LptE [Thalassotalea sp. 1_MG-2023]MDO6426578.1 LPS assembly lipoprotein LptE [Thalassotalea sp. 1_MG-2023]